MVLSKRLDAIVSSVPICESAVDVGCDHGYVAIELVKRKIAKKVYGTDINAGPLEVAKKNVALAGFKDEINLFLCDGLKGLNKIVDTIIIAGMGGYNINHILEESKEKVLNSNQLVLSPHKHIGVVRKELYKLGFFISDEKILEDSDKPYFIIVAKKGCKEVRFPYEYSNNLIQKGDKTYLKYVLAERDKIKKVIHKVPDDRRVELQQKIDELEQVADEIKKNNQQL